MRRTVLAGILLFLVTTSWSLIGALTAPGDDGVSVKLAEWARDHYLGPVVTLAENVQYDLNPPATGGTPDTSQLAAGAAEGSQPNSTSPSRPTTIALAPRLVPPVSPALPGEGVYVPVVSSAAGPLVQQTFVRPDTVHTSYLTGVAWMSHTLHFVLHPGFQNPGLSGMSEPDLIAGKQLPGLVATFNSGFKMQDAEGGYYDHGTTVGTLTAGAASLVIYKDGHATVGTWGKDVSMAPDVAFVRQNLKLLISGGHVAPNLDANVQSTWGATIGGAAAVWRSGLGVTAKGDLVYVLGDAMTVSDLADILHRAGAVNAMQLDINQTWTSFMYYTHYATAPVPHKLGDFQRPVDRYLGDTSRDFVAVYAP
ncbi:MAG: phosphodiester glycosidase family protein [Candidatus Nanopelagicales bacterium]